MDFVGFSQMVEPIPYTPWFAVEYIQIAPVAGSEKKKKTPRGTRVVVHQTENTQADSNEGDDKDEEESGRVARAEVRRLL